MDGDLHYFGAKEYAKQKKFQAKRDSYLGILLYPFVALKISPNVITFISFVCVLLFAYFLTTKPTLAVILLFFHVILDGFDGVLARMTNQSSRAGAFYDILNDHTGLVITVGALLFHQMLDPTLGLAYVYLYSLLVVLLVQCSALKISPPFTVRTKYLVYLLIALYVFTGINYIEIAVAVFTIVTIPFTIDLLRRIVKFLKHT